MGIPLVCICMAVPRPLLLFVKFVDRVRHTVLVLLSFFGLYRSPPPQLRLLSGAPEAPAPSFVKDRLPVVKFASSVDGQRCVFCLERLRCGDEVRELANCRHAFHRCCVDRWIDVGQVTCPLCRSELLPPAKAGRGGGWGWVVEVLGRFW
ncbi:E3 ubiquitin-protein ligase RHA1B-like [Ananas comosus]|uniref:E3 ubiquitin-protein ligase RHA1B-like n=2 Tax=Ananas comosus TaxID=4615 RepID=A0A6P5ES37_ANACO|nr:E3 ubiquitin-protein ligase RHA1B-like [Ananas comosus]